MTAAYYTDTATRWGLLVLAVLAVGWVLWASRNVQTRAEREARHLPSHPVRSCQICARCGRGIGFEGDTIAEVVQAVQEWALCHECPGGLLNPLTGEPFPPRVRSDG